MKRVSLGVLVAGMVLALGLSVTSAQAKPSARGSTGNIAGQCRGMMGPGMMAGPMGRCDCGMMGGCGRVMGPGMMRGPMMGRCDHDTRNKRGWMGRHGGMKGEMGMTGMHHRLWRYMENLNLDQNQRAGIWKIKTDLMKNMIRKKADLKIARLELRELLHADKIDMNKVEAKVKEMEGLRSSMFLSRIEATEKIKSKLTSEQMKKLKDMMHSRMRCFMAGDDMMSGDMSDEGMMDEGAMGKGRWKNRRPGNK